MLYRNSEIEVRPGDVILYHTALSFAPVSWLAWGIRKVTKSNWNHAALVLEIEGRTFIAEAFGGGVRLRPASYFLDRQRNRIKVLRPVYSNLLNAKAKALDKLGCKYDFLAVLQHLWKAIRGKWTGHTGDSAAGRMVCSEYVAYCLGLTEWWTWTAADLDRYTFFKRVFNEQK